MGEFGAIGRDLADHFSYADFSTNRVKAASDCFRVADSASEAISVPRTAEAVTNLLAETMAGIHARRLDPKIGSVMAYLGTALLNALETAELERRITALEKRTSVSEER